METLEKYKTMSWKDLTPEDIVFLTQNGVMNGCGGQGNSLLERFIRWMLHSILLRLRIVFVEASCNIHDFTYWQGGDKKKRFKDDMGFFLKILEDIQKYIKSPGAFVGYVLLALVFYLAVRSFGWVYFNYHE